MADAHARAPAATTEQLKGIPMSPSIIRAVITPADIRKVAEAAAGHPTYPAHVATVTDIRTRRRTA